MEFWHYDITFLIIFSLAVAIFLFRRRKNLKVESKVFILYRTQVGIKFINYIGSKFPKFFKYMTYVVITSGYLLMIAALYFFIEVIIAIIRMPILIKIAKVPPIMPLIPYLPQMFNIDFLPPFYFTYWIISIAIIAICHEFAHGIFARYNKVNIKSTGFGFLGPFLAAFVEPDEKQLAKKSNKVQLAVLSAGSFANLVVTFIFITIMIGFFLSLFQPAGVYFNYIPARVNISDITSIASKPVENLSFSQFVSFIDEFKPEEEVALKIKSGKKIMNLTEIKADNKTYFINIDDNFKTIIKDLEKTKKKDKEYEESGVQITAAEDTPALRAGLLLFDAITKINSVPVKNTNQLIKELGKYEPGNKIDIEVINKDNYTTKTFNITLKENPDNKKAFLGISLLPQEVRGRGIFSFIAKKITQFKNPNIYYKPRFQPYLIIFIYNLLWWVVLINISVALVNMLPLGIFDGGRVFYLTMLALTKSKEKAKKAFKLVTMLVLLLFFFLMFLWWIYI